jgi:hypothetical protein
VVRAVEACALRLDFITRRRGYVHVEIKNLRCLQPRVAYVVRVADPCRRGAR